MGNAFKFSLNADGIGNLVFDLPNEKVNKFSVPVMEEFEKTIDELAKNSGIKALLITSGKPDVFIAGADLKGFIPMFKDPSLVEPMIRLGHRTFNKLQNLPFPTIAVINGACLGGGMEMALACTYRIATDNPKTLLGLPETTLGIIPGWGGTQRMPRLIGLVEGLPLILGGRPVKAQKAWKIHLVDALIAKEFAEEKIQEFVKHCLSPKGRSQILYRRERKGLKHWLLEKNPLGRAFLFNRAEKDVLSKTKGHYPAPVAALKLIKETYTLPLNQGLEKEIETISKNLTTQFSSAQNLIHLFFVQEAMKKDTGAPPGTPTLPVKRAGVLGAGLMGSGISWLFSYNNIPVRFRDVDWTAVGKGYGAASAMFADLVKKKKLKKNEASLKFHNMSGTTDYSGFKNADIIIEAATENIELKHQIFKEIESVVRPDALIASNTSSLTIAEMSKNFQHPERFLAMHFFSPVNRMPLVEVVSGEKTSPEAIATAVELCRKLGKTPLVVKDCPGFLVNRIFVVGANEVLWMLQEGAGFEVLEKMMLNFGMPLSPFVLSDEVGNDVGYKVAKTFEKAYGERMKPPKILEVMYENKLYGKKSGKGFYIYEKKEKRKNPEVDKLLATINGGAKVDYSTILMRDRVILGMVNEASRCLQEKIVESPDKLDMAMIMGTGFPPFRGGLLKFADELGIPYVVDQLKKFSEKIDPRFTPSEYLLEMQRNNKKFFQDS